LIALPVALVLPIGGSAAQQPSPSHALLTYVAFNRGICLIRADGKHSVRLTPRWRGLGTPAWSPRGRYIAFKRSAGAPSTSKIAVADARGHVHWTFGAWDKNGSPLWSPDGRHIAYRGTATNGHNGLDVARPDGSHDHRLLTCDLDYCDPYPSWSADGRRLAFADGSDPSRPVRIVSTLADGSDRHLLVADAYQAAYSPKEPKLAYAAPSGSSRSSLFVANADGTDPHAITPPPAGDVAWLVWSPDGRFLAFFAWSPSGEGEGEIVVVRADGTGEPVVIASHVPWIRTCAPDSWLGRRAGS
jgi:Tol biopolymer transport system component